jgi:hypothetical protein
MASKKAIFKKTVVGEGVAAVMSWAVIGGTRVVTCDGSKIPAPTQAALFVHGMSAKVGDAAAMQEATADEKCDAMEKVIAALYAGEWRGERESGDAMLLDAICEFNPKKAREKHAADLKALSSAEKLQLRTIPQIKKIYDRLLGETAKKSTTKVDDLLAKFAATAE